MISNSNESGITDIESVSENFYSSVRTRSVIEPPDMYESKPQVFCVPQSLRMEFDRILNKPYFIKTQSWSDSDTRNAILTTLKIPLDIFNNDLAKIPFQSSTLYRCKVKLILQTSGTSMHQGLLLAAALPNGTTTGTFTTDYASLINCFMAAPHVFLSANESTSVALEVPFYVNNVLAKTDLDKKTVLPNFTGVNFAEVPILVLNPLVPPTTGSKELSVSIHAVFTDLEFYAPHTDVKYENLPTFSGQGFITDIKTIGTKAIDSTFQTVRDATSDFLDAMRKGIRHYTGLHAPNFPGIDNRIAVVTRQNVNLVDNKVHFEKMDPYGDFDRICSDAIFDTCRDEMDMREILTKPQLIGRFTITDKDTTGTLLWSRPISPFQQVIKRTYTNSSGDSVDTVGFDNLLQTFYSLSKYWKGSLKIHFQAVMSNFHFTKIAIARDYSVREDAYTQYPSFDSVPNLLTETLEFSAGGQIQTIELPFVSPLNQIPCSKSWANLVASLGMYYVYLTQPLVLNGTVSPNIEFNVYISAGDDFQYYGYSTDPVQMYLPVHVDFPPAKEAFEAQASSATVVNDQADITFSEHKSNKYESLDFRPITHIRDYIRRFHKVARYKYTNEEINAAGGLQVYDIAQLLGQRSSKVGIASISDKYTAASTHQLISKMFLGAAGGVRIKLIVTGSSSCSAWYIPPNFSIIRTTSNDVWNGLVPIPPTGTFAPNIPIKNMYQNLKLDNNIQSEYYSCQSVLQERPNHYATGSQGFYSATSSSYIAEGVCELEFEIPNMSPFKFVGDTTKLGTVNQELIANTSTSNMGHIVLYTAPTAVIGGSELNQSVAIFAAYDDVARLGYQVFSPSVVYPVEKRSTESVALTTGYFVTGYAESPVNPYPVCFYSK